MTDQFYSKGDVEISGIGSIESNPFRRDDLAEFCLRHYFLLLTGILVIGLSLRIFLAMNSTFFWDEDRDWILTAVNISFDPDAPYLPIRTDNHGALVAYLIWLGSLIGDGSHLAYRWTSILAGGLTIATTAMIARRTAGPTAGIIAAAIVSFNEYHITISMLAIQLSWYTLFTTIGILFFLDYLDRRAGWRLMLAGLFSALSFLAYEIAALAILIMGLYGLIRIGRSFFLRRELYLVAALMLVIILPDLHANLVAPGGIESYDSFLARIHGIGINPQFAALLFPETIRFLYETILDRSFLDYAHDFLGYKAMNSVWGLVLCLGVIFWLLAALKWIRIKPPRHSVFFLMLFCGIFGFFTLINTRENYALWLWAGIILIPGAILAGGLAAKAPGVPRTVVVTLSVIATIICLASLATTNFGLMPIKGHTQPSLLTGPPGSMAEVEVHFEFCDLCNRTPELRLKDIGYVRDPFALDLDENPPPSIMGTRDVLDAVPQTDDRRFSLRLEDAAGRASGMYRLYVIWYEIVRQGNATDLIEVRADAPFDQFIDQATEWPPIFWLRDQTDYRISKGTGDQDTRRSMGDLDVPVEF